MLVIELPRNFSSLGNVTQDPLLTWVIDHPVFIDHIDRALAMMTLITFQVP
jgi:hypothetical protein